jgi:hypothetical protein
MKFNQQSIIKEYVRNISDDDLRYIGTRISERLGGDLGDAINVMGRNRNMDEILRSARGAVELYEICDFIEDLMWSEAESRRMLRNEE